jgi:hypothetical protein
LLLTKPGKQLFPLSDIKIPKHLYLPRSYTSLVTAQFKMLKNSCSRFLSATLSSILLVPLLSSKSNASELGSYWYGFGIGATSTICSLQQEGLLSKSQVGEFMSGMRQAFQQQKDQSKLDMGMFEKGVRFSRGRFPTCNI